MKYYRTFIIILLTLLSACQRSDDETKVNLEFNEADKKITEYLDILNDPNSNIEVKSKILCKNLPQIYEYEYIPALMKSVPNTYSTNQLLLEQKNMVNYYREKLMIAC